ncbi:MAG: laccase domain-containing protein, partial [Actinobacteria bacterium]|nr:laccase domain-containing protein [Actinomycetota bacterium]
MSFVAELPGGRSAHGAFSQRADGNFDIAANAGELHTARQRLLSGPWTSLAQVHGAQVRHVAVAEAHLGASGDGLVTATPGIVLGVQTADCVPVLFASVDGEAVVGAAHAGWRGLYDGIVEATVRQLRELGAGTVRAWIGPCIGASAY